MNELIKEWLNDMFDSEINEVIGTLQNEKIWLDGCTTFEQVEMHAENIKNLSAYITTLKELKKLFS